MPSTLEIDYACRTEAGDKAENADATGARVPEGELLLTKGAAAVIADGVSSSEGGREASEVCVTGFLSDYFSTPESWTVKHSAARVLGAINRWLYGQGQSRYDSAKGMVTTFSALVIKSTTAHLLHVGDSRIYLYREGELEQLTRDHRVWVSKEREFLARAMGVDPHVDIDYRALAVDPGDLFLFITDGVHEFLSDNQLRRLVGELSYNLQHTANTIVERALTNGSSDNVTCQLLRVLTLPSEVAEDIYQRVTELPFPPDLKPGMTIDGYRILREIHASRRSEVFLALDTENDRKLILKTPSVNYRDDPEFLDGFLHEEWVGRRLDNLHVLKVYEPRRRRFLYHLTEYVEGQSLRQWMHDHPEPSLSQVRNFIGQIVEGLRAFHRMEMIHQDLKPDNLLIDREGTLKLIDFGSTRIAGVDEINRELAHHTPQGTVNYTAPEYLEGDQGSNRSDIFSLGVIAYEMLTGKLPHGDSETPRPGHKLHYTPARQWRPDIPLWMDAALAKALHPRPSKRYALLSEFLYDLSHPNKAFIEQPGQPLIERNPVGFWRGLALILFLLDLWLLYRLMQYSDF
jgi:serine/threonine protein phosphatase PrpC